MSFEEFLGGGQVFVAFGPKYEGPPPALGVFDTFPKLGCFGTQLIDVLDIGQFVGEGLPILRCFRD